LSEVEVDAFGSFVKKSVQRLEIRTPRRAGWARVGDLGCAVILCWSEPNGLRPHRALREAGEGLPEGQRDRPRTPAMAIGWIDHIWSWEECLTFPYH
jgi:hypothetical protein